MIKIVPVFHFCSTFLYFYDIVLLLCKKKSIISYLYDSPNKIFHKTLIFNEYMFVFAKESNKGNHNERTRPNFLASYDVINSSCFFTKRFIFFLLSRVNY